MTDPGMIVRKGYDRLVDAYLADRGPTESSGWLDRFAGRLRPGGLVLDLGCGAGVPVAKGLTEQGFQVVGVDISPAQIARAESLVPGGRFFVGDMVTVEFESGTFDGICALYSIIHVAKVQHAGLLKKVRQWLRPGGTALLVLGAEEWEGEEPYLMGVPMYWSHFGIDTNRGLLAAAGLDVVEEGLVADPPGAHWYVLVE